MVGGFLYLITRTFGAVRGTEFSPDTFERRSFQYYQLPLVHLQLTGEKQEDTSGATELFVLNNNYVTPAQSLTPEWHVVSSWRGAVPSTGDAQILMQYLDAKTSDNYHRWVKWSEDHTAAAKVLWPAVQQLAQHKLYVHIPDLFDAAKRCDDSAKLKTELDRIIASRVPATEASEK